MASTNQGASSGAGDVSPTENGSGHATNPKMRKRTKTGCLTCRKRRIKCGEERPTCGNCIKSKRQCEGYNQRVIFKTPLGEWPNPGVVSELQYHSSMLPGTRNPGYRGGPPTVQSQDNALTSIRPRPLTNFDFSNVETGPIPGLDPLNTQGLVGGHRPYDRDLNYPHPLSSPRHQQPLHSPQHQLPTPTSTTSYFPNQSPAHASFPAHFTHEANVGYSEQRYAQDQFQQTPVSYDGRVDQKPALSQAPQEHLLYHQTQRPSRSPEEQNIHQIHSNPPSRAEEYPQYAAQRPPLNRYGSSPQVQSQQLRVGAVDMSQAGAYALPPHTDFNLSSFRSVQIPSHDADSDVKYVPQHAALEQPIAVSLTQQNEPQLLLSGFGGEDHVSPTQVLDEAAIECEDDDYYDVQSDEEMPDRDDEKEEDMVVLSQDYSLIRRIHFENTSELTVRRYDAFIYDGFLTHYKAENVANPLKNPKTARVFAHFIHITGPSLSIYERNPRNPNPIFDRTTPPGLQSLWTDILPMKALNHQGLLHAMLALASLHIARLQGASVTPSYKHYAYALKRLGRSLGNPKKRLTTQTLATSLLLAFYEVMTAEHVKWSTHLVGAAYLLSELDFRSLTQQARRLKAEQTAQEEQFPYQNPDMLIDQRQFEQKIKESAMTPDENMVSTIVGKKVNYDDFGSVFEEGNTRHERKRPTPGDFDLHNYETLQDLFWWYARHDTFQSMVSGNPLIMAYRKWSDCPPRAPLGRVDALYGSHDHIILLIARIADFTVRDRERKLRQVDANGGQWKPTQVTDLFCRLPGMGPPPQGESQNRPPTTPMGPLPQMQGMGPPPGWTGPPPPGWGGPPQGPNPQMPPPDFMPPQGQGPPLGPTGPPTGPPRGPPPAGSMPNFYGMAPTRPPISLPASYANPNGISGQHSPQTPNMPHPKFSDLPAEYQAALADWNSISHAHATVARFLANSEAFAPMTPDLLPPIPGGNMTPFGPALMHRSYSVSILWTLLHLSSILLLRSHPSMPPAAMVASAVCAPATQPYAILIGRIAAGMQIPATSLTPSLGAALIESTMSLFFAGIQYKESPQRDWLITRLLEIDRRTGWASAGVIARSCETSWERAADVGRGPPYDRRRTRRFGEEGSVVLDPDLGASRGQDIYKGSGAVGNFHGKREHIELGWKTERQLWEADGRDRRFVVKYRTGAIPWAMNLLGTDEDLRVGMENVGINGEANVAETERGWVPGGE